LWTCLFLFFVTKATILKRARLRGGKTWQLCGAQRWDNLAAVWGPTLGQPGSCVGPNVGTTWQLYGAQLWDNLAAVWGPTLGQPGSCVGLNVGTTWQLCGAQRWDNLAAVWGAKLGQPGSCVGPNVYGALRHHWHSWKYDASKLTFPHGKEFLRKLSTVWSRALRNFRQPWLRPKKLKYIELSGAHCVEPAVIPTEVLVVSVNISKSHLLAHFLFWTKERKKDRILDMYKREVCVSSASATHLLPRLPVCSSLCACQVVAMADGLSRRAARYVCFATVA